ncbi:carboxymuconolactone decarboxylase family protein [Streptomyces sp. NPDC058953]|uniref:carboxymuconolactone decarboxylase family protein n=1 Tax=unclassified Streptomyces TaxID=2593676 RepID=UPI0036973CE5
MTTPRIRPLAPEHHAPEVRGLLARVPHSPLRTSNLNATVAHHPALFVATAPFSTALLFNGLLPARDRELVILRTAHLADSAYVRSHHIPLAHRAGLTEAEIVRTASGPAAEGWSRHDAALLAAADELHHRAAVTDETWHRLSESYDTRQLIEVVVLAGYYRMWSATANSWGVELDPVSTSEEGPDAVGG